MVVLLPSVTEPFMLNLAKLKPVLGTMKGPVDPESCSVVTSANLIIVADTLTGTACPDSCSDVSNWPLYVLPSPAIKLTVVSSPLNGAGRLSLNSVVGPAASEDIIIWKFRVSRLRLIERCQKVISMHGQMFYLFYTVYVIREESFLVIPFAEIRAARMAKTMNGIAQEYAIVKFFIWAR